MRDRSTRWITLAAVVTFAWPAHADILHSIFTDHVVLQRDQPIRVWGQAKAGERIDVMLGEATSQTNADASGTWQVMLPPRNAGGPHVLTAATGSGERQHVRDVMIGDVWLCSGQSNMVLQVHRALDAYSEIANANNDSIRLLTVPQASNTRPQSEFAAPVAWRPLSSTSAPEFSAVCLYFARELQKTVDVPMGLIAAAWGGSKIEPWLSAAALRAHGGYGEALDILELTSTQPFEAHARWGRRWEQWWQSRDSSKPWARNASGAWRDAPNDLTPWEVWGDPQLEDHDGMVWYRASVSLTPTQTAQAATLSLGRIDEFDQTWVNGEPIGARAVANLTAEERSAPVRGSGGERTYRLPRGALMSGENVIVVNVLDTYAKGGMYGPASSRALRLQDGTTIPLTKWKYQSVPTSVGAPPRAPWENVAGLGVIYNGMIAPLARFGIRGVAWYQGESNTETAGDYGPLLKTFMADWRSRFGPDLPFLIVQLANYGSPHTRPIASDWAVLREQQRRAVANDRHAGLAVTIDIGDRYDIHPANKQEVGRRLALAARHVVFNEPIAPSGPQARNARRDNDQVVVTFEDVTGELVAYSADAPVGFELCGVEQSSCRFVSARIDTDRVRLDASATKEPTRVRYCWADAPVCTLYDAAQLPAGPFEIEIEP